MKKILFLTIPALLYACGVDDDPQLALDTCNEWCDQQEQSCGAADSAESCKQNCGTYRNSLPQTCLGEWRLSLECQIDQACHEHADLNCIEEAIEATECVQTEH